MSSSDIQESLGVCSSLASLLSYVGTTDRLSDIQNPQIGYTAILSHTNETYVYDGNEWIELGNDADMSASTKRHLPFTICKHCGAPLPKYDFYATDFVKCEYCKSIYYYDAFDYS